MNRRLLLLAALLISGCTSAPATLDAVQVAAAAGGTLQALGTAAAIAETQTATQLWPTATATPTITPSPTATATDTATPTATPTPLPSGTVLAADRLRGGPGLVYPTVAQLAGGESAQPLGQTADGSWLLIALAEGPTGWLPAENFALTAGNAELPIITDLPPTPTVPPSPVPTATPLPTATNTPSPWTCDVSISASTFAGYVIIVGSGWPPNQDISLAYGDFPPYPRFIRSGGADSPTPNGFWHTMPYTSGTLTFATEGCSRTVTYP